MKKRGLKDKIVDELITHAIFSKNGPSMNRTYAAVAASAVLSVIEEAGYSVVRVTDLPLCGDSRRTLKPSVNND
jgi:hypothetical protein